MQRISTRVHRISRKFTPLVLALLVLAGCSSHKQEASGTVNILGQMRNVMWKGQLEGTIRLDTLINKTHLYGLGPVAYLTGEILIIDGKSYRSTVVNDTAMDVVETYALEAPFFAYANIPKWSEQPLPDSIQTIQQLERYLDHVTQSRTRPFLFKLSGIVDQANIHIVNLPESSTVSSPDEVHRGQVNYILNMEPADIIGFFSTKHKGIFTHHDTYLHMHLITSDRKKMGHLDQVIFGKKGMKLYLHQQ